MTWHEQNVKYNALIKQLFHDEKWQKRAEAARELGIMEEGRAVNLLCRALKSEKDHSDSVYLIYELLSSKSLFSSSLINF